MMERSKLRCGDAQQLRSMGWGRGEHPSDYQLFEYRNQIDWLLASDMCAGRVANPSVKNLAIPIVHLEITEVTSDAIRFAQKLRCMKEP